MDKIFPATIEKLYDMIAYISIYARQIGFNNEMVKNIELVVEEALVNVIIHGYQQIPGGSIAISLNSTIKPGIIITITDEGVPFDPKIYDNQAFSALQKNSMKKGQEAGGWGLFLIFKIMDTVDYARVEGKNILKLEKYL